MLKVLDRYLLNLLWQVALFGIVLFSIIWLAPETMFKLIQYVFDGQLTWQQGLIMLAYHVPETLQQAIPMAALFAGIFVFRQLSLNYELVAMLSHGISLPRVMMPVLAVGVCLGALHFLVQEVLIPYTAPRLQAYYEAGGIKSRAARNFTFVERTPAGSLDKFLFIGQAQDFTSTGDLSDFIVLFYQQATDGGVYISRIFRAPKGFWDEKAGAWQLRNGMAYLLSESGVYEQVAPFVEQAVSMSPYPYQLLNYSTTRPKNMSWAALNRYIHLLMAGGQDQEVDFFLVRLYQKFAFPLATACFVILGTLLGVEKFRSRRHYSLTFGTLILFLYSVTIPFSTNLGGLGVLPPIIIAWMPLALSLGVGGLILYFRNQLSA